LNVLVVGGGMYVAGRGAEGYRGTIMPAVLEARRADVVGAVAVATTRAETAEAAARETAAIADAMGVDGRCEAFADVAAARAFDAHAAIVVVPDHLHAKVVIPLIERGIHCLVVKPLAGETKDAHAMVDAAQKAGVVAEVEFHKRLDESNLLLRHKIASGALGTPLYATVEYSQRKSVPRDIFRAWSSQTSIFQYLGVHYVDLLEWATGYVPVRATAWGQKEYLANHGVDTWDAIQAAIEWRRPDGGRFVSNFATNWIDPEGTTAMSNQRIVVVGTEGRYDADQTHRGIRFVADGAGAQDVSPYFTGAWQDNGGRLSFHGYGIASVRQFLDDVAGARDGQFDAAALDATRPTFKACFRSVSVIEAMHESLANDSAPVEIRA
jgi:predicted dehydrogenase